MSRSARRFRRKANGGYELNLPAEERELLANLPVQIEGVIDDLATGDRPIPEIFQRLFPSAYPTDPEAEAGFVDLTRTELLEHHKDVLGTMKETVESTVLDEDALEAWLAALNDLRLVIGTSIGVSEDEIFVAEDDPKFGEWLCYQYLTYLQGEIVEALSSGLPPPDEVADDDLPTDPWGEPPGDLRWDGTEQPPRGAR